MSGNRVVKEAAASRAYGRGSDNYRSPARYAVVRDGKRIGIILGTDAGFMEKSRWSVEWLQPSTGLPRTVFEGDSFAIAKAWAESWDGQGPVRWRNE